MSKFLFVLESPNKVAKIQGFLGDEYLVTASKGHIRCLGEGNDIGINIDDNFATTFYVDPKKTDVVARLRKDVAKCTDPVYLATDFDREGEAISWHIREVLKLSPGQVKRVVFTEITRRAVLDALANPKELDMNMVHSQLARQVLDKIIGYRVSPCLWKEFKNRRLSAGRVQSVVTKLIIEREKEISKFTASNYFRVHAGFNLIKPDPKKPELLTELETRLESFDDVSCIVKHTETGEITYWIEQVSKTKTKRQPSAPYITSSLQQEASNKLGMSPEETMSAAQKLYEAGLITYMRTDSLMLSEESLGKIGDYVKTSFGPDYHKKQQYTKKSKNAQEAHEAIRPTDVTKQDVTKTDNIKPREAKLYGLIWKKTVASQMAPADMEIKTVKIRMDTSLVKPGLIKAIDPQENNKLIFVTKHEKVLFDGYLKLYSKSEDIDPEANTAEDGEPDAQPTMTESKRLETLFDSLKKGAQVWCSTMDAEEKQTKPPNSRYTEASLIKKLEELGIGRPSTYATMVSKVQERTYVEKKDLQPKDKECHYMTFKYPNAIDTTVKTIKIDGEKNKLVPSGLGIMITGFLIKHFELFMDYEFTAIVETLLDNIADGSKEWQTVVKGVWDYLYPIISKFDVQLAGEMSGTVQKVKARVLGVNPATGLEVKLIKTQYGMQVLEEDLNNSHNNKYASIGFHDPDTITLDDAVALLIWPKQLGEYNGYPVTLNKKHSIYVANGPKTYSIDSYIRDNPTVQYADREKMSFNDAVTIIKYFDTLMQSGGSGSSMDTKITGATDYFVRKGPYGYYIKYLNTFNVPLPYKLKKDITGINKETCDAIVKAYLESKGQAGSVTDIAIKPSVTKSVATANSKAGAGKNTAKKTDAGSVGPADKKPRASRKKKE